MMDTRRRNTAYVLLAAGIFLFSGNLISFMFVSALVLILLGIHLLRTAEGKEKSGYIVLGVGVLLLVGDQFAILIAIVLISLGVFYIKSKKHHANEDYIQKQNLLESLKWDRDPWVLKNMSIWFVVGEIRLDLSLAIWEGKEITLVLQGLIGDVDIVVPEEFGIMVEASVPFGQIDIGPERESGVLNKLVWKSPNYEQSEHKVKLLMSYIAGDIDVKIL